MNAMSAGGGDKTAGVENFPHPLPDSAKSRDKAGAQYAEHYGNAIGGEVLHGLFNAKDQAEACRALMDGLISAFNPSGDPLVDAVIGGFSVRLVNVLERGVAAIKAGPVEDEPC